MNKDLVLGVIAMGLCVLGKGAAAESPGGVPVTIEYYYCLLYTSPSPRD